jgi:hypothetical protein
MMDSGNSSDGPSAGTGKGGFEAEPTRAAAVSRLSPDQVWRVLERTSAAVLGHVTPAGAPRTSGVVYVVIDRRLYVAVAPDSWKARQIATGQLVSVTALVRRGGVLSLIFPIPPATITFSGRATVYPPGAPEAKPLLARLARLLPPDRRESVCLIGIEPEGTFLTYGIGVPLKTMGRPEEARARVPVA